MQHLSQGVPMPWLVPLTYKSCYTLASQNRHYVDSSAIYICTYLIYNRARLHHESPREKPILRITEVLITSVKIKRIFFLQDERVPLAASRWVHAIAGSYKSCRTEAPQSWRARYLKRLLQIAPVETTTPLLPCPYLSDSRRVPC